MNYAVLAERGGFAYRGDSAEVQAARKGPRGLITPAGYTGLSCSCRAGQDGSAHGTTSGTQASFRSQQPSGTLTFALGPQPPGLPFPVLVLWSPWEARTGCVSFPCPLLSHHTKDSVTDGNSAGAWGPDLGTRPGLSCLSPGSMQLVQVETQLRVKAQVSVIMPATGRILLKINLRNIELLEQHFTFSQDEKKILSWGRYMGEQLR